ncbi:MAG: hypothetical protein O3A93_11395 [Chloroflexi bacterium]|nr:hypothetical protein [Chloroflexota bacterium]MDA1271843.1 hypothetical protein [Chloroflexota bacterium]
MFWLKSCPRCFGDLYDNADIYGNYIDCLQCGHYLTVEEEDKIRSEHPFGKVHVLRSDEPIRVLTEIAA